MDYYNRYKAAAIAEKFKIYSMNIVSDIVQKHGYKKIKPDKKHVWVKN
jgi:hypothetical protein